MTTLNKYPQRQDCFYKLSSGNSGETSINLSKEIFYFIKPEDMNSGETRDVTFRIYKDDYIKALCFIINKLPLYKTTSKQSEKVNFSLDLFSSILNKINNFFGDNESKLYNVKLLCRNDNRYYLNDLNNNDFNIRNFLVENNSKLSFLKGEDDENIILRLFSDIEDQRLFSSYDRNVLFINYLLNQELTNITLTNYLKAFSSDETIKNVIKDCSNTEILFEIDKLIDAEQLYQFMLGDDRNKIWNHTGSSMLKHYKEFIEKLNKRELIDLSLGLEDKYKKYIIVNKNNFPVVKTENIPNDLLRYKSAIKTRPFVLLAGISGTGKSRIVRQLARACVDYWGAEKPENFEMIQVKPNWHDSSELLGYVSRISGKDVFVMGDFLNFIIRAWENLDTPHFLCLDEMNLAPVEQYFAEYLSVIETRRKDNGRIITDPILKESGDDWYNDLLNTIYDDEVRQMFRKYKGIPIPQNLIVMGTVNMDETTFSFSRKVLDRAMTIEMNEVKLDGGLTEEDLQKEQFTIGAEDIIPQVVEGKDVYGGNKDLCDKVIAYLQKVNDVLEGTPFKIAYRTRNEFLIYAVNRGVEKYESGIDEMTSMKILSRIEGDAAKLLNVKGECVLSELHKLLIEVGLNVETSLSLQKINEMQKRLNTGYTSYWS